MTAARLVGRDRERGVLEAFLERGSTRPAALFISGDAGIGKTTVWEAGVQTADDAGRRILLCRAAESEATLSFTGLADLIEGRLDEVLAALDGPRRRAVEVALLIEDPGTDEVDQRAVCLAFLDAVRALARRGPLLVAVDDLQWLDTSSAAVLQFALRRLRHEPVGFLATVRTEKRLQLALDPESSEELHLGPLSLGALHRVLASQLDLNLTRPEVARLQEVTGGNPFFALELGRELLRTDERPAPGRPLPIPGDIRALLGARIARLPAKTREVLLLAATLARPSITLLERVYGSATDAAIARAARVGVVELDGDRVRFSHPLLASVCYQESPLWERREAHRRLAAVVPEFEERARHLALAASGPDAKAADALERASERAVGRGATAAAAELAELASELTRRGPAARRGLLLHAAEFLRLAGDRARAAELLEGLLADAAGDERADVLIALARTRRGSVAWSIALCQDAVESTTDDARLADTLAFLSFLRVLEGDLYGALTAARAGLERAERVGNPELVARAIGRVASAEQFVLDITPNLLERGVALEEALPRRLEYPESPIVTMCRRLALLGELSRARELLVREEALAAERGDEGTRAQLLFYLVMLEWHAGRWHDGLSRADAALELAEQLGDDQYRGMVLYGQATLHGHLGDVERARALAAEASALAETTGDASFPIWNASLLGFLELSLGDPLAAAGFLHPLPALLLEQGWNEPGDPWPEAIEALASLGELEEAESLTTRFEGLAGLLGAPHALALAARCRGLVLAAGGHLDLAEHELERSLAEHARSEYPFELGRTLLVLGGIRRRAKQKRAAREASEAALAIFEELGAACWAERARDELSHIPGRRAPGDTLTATEAQVAQLAAAGRSNKEIAASLHVTVHTVEAHLTRAYRKLGIRARGELRRNPLFAPDGAPKV
jgi:DNA-binding CsgD family transcriptional regulator